MTSERSGHSASREAHPGAPHRSAAGGRTTPWSEAEAERHLRSLELFGMRFGLDRMRRMMTALGSPQRRFDTIHVLGTNGKSSTTRMIAAILERHGLRTSAYTSPHLVSYTERVQVAERDLDSDSFAAAVARAAWAAEHVNRTLSEDDHVTQFELLTAAALWEMAEQGVEVAVLEAGLGGRYDATSVVESRVTVLTNVGLEHTRWLGPTLRDIAEEKLAVLQPHTTLVLGADLAAPALEVAERVAGERAVRDAAASTAVPGRLQLIEGEPLTVFDGAHNPHAVAALVESLPEVLGGRPTALVLGVLEDKDAAGMLAALLGVCERAWFTAPPGSRALSPAALQSLARQLGFEDVSSEPTPSRALAEARRWAGERSGAVLVTGSVYLVGELLAQLDSGGTLSGPRSSRAAS
jgi:dihydrofolate synthase/folylpolyglutamate synthase